MPAHGGEERGVGLRPGRLAARAKRRVHLRQGGRHAVSRVVGFSGAKGLARLLVGSVSQWVLTHAATDVLVTAG